ncbi:DUF4350 domain-containing protein [Streptomyces sp. TRM 70361]|uniref:DUF4350 domain-containing protein n=1 Tax=Streptomyces sp. TRM 70361 TaxID=3116553 RepID=UPI002E7C110F|nr:DUF4350 domain-containing protein [Streptomyces sp. TRM 70361]MEE1937821.1 DUF4350 domain-containing protein [Streptomyces sp. TRM 70361]
MTTAPSTAPPVDTAPATSVSPTAGLLWSRARGLLVALTVLALAGLVIAAVRSGEQHGRLDPRSADRNGSRATAELLADRGVGTTVATTVDEAVAAVGPDTTLLVTNPDLLSVRQQSALRAATSGSGGRTVLLAPGPASLDTLAPGVRAVEPVPVQSLPPECDAPYARRAGSAELGGITYTTSAATVDACYPTGELPTLLRLPDDSGNGDTVVLGAPDLLYNSHLDDHGNASLALQLLGSRPHLVWYLPSLDDTAATDGGDQNFLDLIPPGWKWGALQLAVAAVLAALWRARRLGPLVPERLPVAVPASETTEGRARLYRQANARDRAADALRFAARARLAPLAGISASRAHAPEALCPAVADRLDCDAARVRTLLFGPAPADDDALVRLADELDLLERRISPTTRDKDRTP